MSGFNGLARAGLPAGSGLSDEVVPFYHFLKDTDGALRTGTVYTLEYWAKEAEWDAVRGVNAAWELFVGGDFNRMGDPTSGDWMSNPDEVHFVARCVYEASREQFTMQALAAAGQAAAPAAPVRVMALDTAARVLYVGCAAGPIHKLDLDSQTWGWLQPTLDVAATARPLAITFDVPSGTGFVAYGAAGLRAFVRGAGGQEAAASAVPPVLQSESEQLTALVLGLDPVEGHRGVFVAGVRLACPSLYFLALEGGGSSARGGWQQRELGGCVTDQGANSVADGEEILVKSLAFSWQDRVLFMAGAFSAVAGSRAANIAASSDGGRSWSALGVGEVPGVANLADGVGPIVSDVVVIPAVDVARVEPSDAPPLARPILTVYGSGFKAFPGPHNPLRVRVGGTECEVTAIVGDDEVTCRTPKGFGAGLLVSAGLGSGDEFRRGVAPFSYWAPVLGDEARVTSPVAASVGGYDGKAPLFHVIGRHFGYMVGSQRQVEVMVGESKCLWEEWISDSSIGCRLQPGGVGGLRQTRNLAVTAVLAGRRAAPSSRRFSYLAPEVLEVAPSVMPTTGVPATDVVTLQGRSFGSARDMARAISVGGRPCDAQEGWISDTSIVCAAPGPGVGLVALAVTVASQECGRGCLASGFRYAAPDVREVKASSLPLATAGGGALSVTGSGFGLEAGARVSLGASECAQTRFVSDSSLVCTPRPGAGAHLQLAVEVGGQRWVAPPDGVSLEYAPPVLADVWPRLVPKDGGAVLTVRGRSIHANAKDYEAVWQRVASPQPREFVGSVLHISQAGEGDEMELRVETPGVPAGAVVLFLRAAGEQASNQLIAECDAASDRAAGGVGGACLHFADPSPLLSITVEAESGGAPHGVTEHEGIYDAAGWRDRLASLLEMPSEELYISSVQANVSEDAGGRGRPARRLRSRHEEANPSRHLRGHGRRRQEQAEKAGGAQLPGRLAPRNTRDPVGSWQPITRAGGRARALLTLQLQLCVLSRQDSRAAYRTVLQALRKLWATDAGRAQVFVGGGMERLGKGAEWGVAGGTGVCGWVGG